MAEEMPERIWAEDISVKWIPTWRQTEPSPHDEYAIKCHEYIRADLLEQNCDILGRVLGHTNKAHDRDGEKLQAQQSALEAARDAIDMLFKDCEKRARSHGNVDPDGTVEMPWGVSTHLKLDKALSLIDALTQEGKNG